ncbi:hypothetical protein Tco_0371710 [Tanacetum coccineum]
MDCNKVLLLIEVEVVGARHDLKCGNYGNLKKVQKVPYPDENALALSGDAGFKMVLQLPWGEVKEKPPCSSIKIVLPRSIGSTVKANLNIRVPRRTGR